MPELEPPGQWSRFHGFLGTGNGLVASATPMANSIVTSFPVITAPAARSLATTGPSLPAPHAGSSTRLLAVVGPSPVARMSLMPIGMPWYGPRSVPSAKALSARSAAASADSSSRVT